MKDKCFPWSAILTAAICIGGMSSVAHGQNYATTIRVLDASGVEGISGVVLLLNPGDARKSQALVTDAQGEATTHGLQCDICTISAFDPRGLFANETTEFASSSPSLRLVMRTRPLIDTVGDPMAISLELVFHGPNREPIGQQKVVIRPLIMTMEDNRVSIPTTDQAGRLSIQLRAGAYVVATLNGASPSEVRFNVATAKEQCKTRTVSCIVAPPSTRYPKPVVLQLAPVSLH
jgi:hypothetical protein